MKRLLVIGAAMLALASCNNTGDDKKDDLPDDSTGNGGGQPQSASMAAKTDAGRFLLASAKVERAGTLARFRWLSLVPKASSPIVISRNELQPAITQNIIVA